MAKTAPAVAPGRDASGPGALFVADGLHFQPTSLTEGPWDPAAQFGGAPAALLATVVEQTPSLVPLQVARLTVDLMRPVPLTPLRATSEVIREGKRIQLVQASLWAGGVEVARATGLRLRITDLGDVDLPAGEPVVPGPAQWRAEGDGTVDGRDPPGSHHAVEYLHHSPGKYMPNPTWVRLRVAVIAGQPVLPLARLAYLADLASGLGNHLGVPITGINADLSLNVVRAPDDGWLCLAGQGWTSQAGVGQVQATLSDSSGIVAGVSVVRLVDRTPAG
jgi:hypothetical protein